MLPERKRKIAGLPTGVALYGLMSTDLNRWLPVRVNEDGEFVLDEPVQVAGDMGIVRQDDINGTLEVIESFHHEIHQGDTFVVSSYNNNIVDAASIIFHLTPGPTYSHLTFTASMGGDATIEILENPTITGGAAHAERNLKRTEPDTPDTVVLLDPTINADGTNLFIDFIPGGAGGNALGGNLGLRPNTEWILDPDKTYAVRLTNVSGQAKKGALVCEWYEESNN